MSVNEGPEGQTFEIFSTCGPILQGYPDASKYYPAKELGIDCPTSVCVEAGRLEFGEPWEQRFAIGLVWFTLISSIALWFFYTWSTFKATCGWEEFYVVNMESTVIFAGICSEISVNGKDKWMVCAQHHVSGTKHA